MHFDIKFQYVELKKLMDLSFYNKILNIFLKDNL